MQIGGGVTASNAKEYIDAGASHVIVTSYVFSDGKIKWENLKNLVKAVGKQHVVLDLSCRRKGDDYYIVTNRWQTFTETKLEAEVLLELAGYCDEFLVHGVDVEGKSAGVDENLVAILNEAMILDDEIVITYAGGIGIQPEHTGNHAPLQGSLFHQQYLYNYPASIEFGSCVHNTLLF